MITMSNEQAIVLAMAAYDSCPNSLILSLLGRLAEGIQNSSDIIAGQITTGILMDARNREAYEDQDRVIRMMFDAEGMMLDANSALNSRGHPVSRDFDAYFDCQNEIQPVLDMLSEQIDWQN